MSEKRIQFNNIIQNQLPSYVREEFPLVAEFLKQYYISQEFESSPTDIIQNIDQYIKLDNIKLTSELTLLTSDISFLDETIPVSSTIGFPDSYGLIQIDNEIITYTSKTSNSFLGCIRGFSGTTSYRNENKQDELVFKTSESSDHKRVVTVNGEEKVTEVINLSSLFLKEFFNKIKYQLTPGFENREFYSELDEYLFLKQSKDFYSTRGTDISFKILFKVLYGEDVKIIKPQDNLIKPSDAQYNITNDLVVESIIGNPEELVNSTLFQDEYKNTFTKGYAPISKVEKIIDSLGKVYYKLSFDAGYNKDINVEGSLYGNFLVHPKTKVIGNVVSGDTIIDVDSTVGFPQEGDLSVLYSDGTEGLISYTSKSLNQFWGCKNVTKTILDTTSIALNVYAYGKSNKNLNEEIRVRITSVLKNVDIIGDTYFYKKDNKGVIKNLGLEKQNNPVFDNWLLNTTKILQVTSIELVDNINQKYKLVTKNEHDLRIGDKIKLKSNSGLESYATVEDAVSAFEILIKEVNASLNVNSSYTIQRQLLKVNSPSYPSLENQLANVQNVYGIENRVLVSSQSLPYYTETPINNSVEFLGSFNTGITSIFTTTKQHTFYTGDAVYYTPNVESEILPEGLYYIKRIDENNLKFSKSRENIYNSNFIVLENSSSISGNIKTYEFKSKTLTQQNILREIAPPINDGQEYSTTPGSIGILVNGVELLNYKSKDQIFYGPIEEISVVGSSSDYDVINPPILSIEDSVGYGATGYCSVKGSLQEIRIVDPGFDYLETPTINITGGNGTGAKAKALMKLVDHKVTFNSEEKSARVNISQNTIGFSTYHKFRNAEQVIYDPQGQLSVGGISTNSFYYVSVKDSYTLKLHKTFNDAVSGINTVTLTSYGVGNHILKSYSKKSILSAINIEDVGTGYENKKRTTSAAGINTSLGYIKIDNHDFKSGEVVQYSTNGTAISGLVNNEKYFVTKVDDSNFKLSSVGIGSIGQDFYYKTNQYISITSVGSGIHYFNYPPISVELVGTIGISSVSGSLFKAQVQPIFRGEITSIHLESKGVGYGSSEVINFKRDPLVSVRSGSDAKLVPIVNNGKIVDILINNPGKNYNSPPTLNIIGGSGSIGAVLTPIIDNGQIKSVKIVESGFGYDQKNTSITVSPAGTFSEFKPKLKSWRINLFAKYQSQLKSDDGFIFNNPTSKYGLSYSHLYTPRKLRESLYSNELRNKVLYGKYDLIKQSGNEVSSTKHSPIVGWAYDGNPIYGPYGYAKKEGGSIVSQVKSGYIQNIQQQDRPPFFPGFFVEDYQYQNSDDDLVLDEYNGRFCATPDFPNGVYAYFTTISEEFNEDFDNYKIPVFPYVIGNKFKSSPNKFNFERNSNQQDINLNQTKWLRYTSVYDFLSKDVNYPYINLPNSLNQTVDITYASPGSIERVDVTFGGQNYKVNDKVIFDDTGTDGFGFSSKVSKIKGKEINTISVASTTVYNTEIYQLEGKRGTVLVQSNNPHNLLNRDIVTITGLNTTSSSLKGSYTIDITTNTLAISNPSGVGAISSTGITTYIDIRGNLDNVKENDVFLLDSERIKVLDLDRKSSRIRVLRAIDGTVGASHSYGNILYEVPRRFSINVGNTTSYNYKLNKEIYFNPKESVALGNLFGVGIGSTLYFSNPGAGLTQVFIPTKAIYLPNHKLETGDSLTYSTYGGTGILVSQDGSTSVNLQNLDTVYVAKISNDLVGISTVKVGIGTTGTFVGVTSATKSISTLYFTGIGTGNYHSFKTNYPKVSGQVTKNIVTVSTAETHGLTNNDYVFVNVSSGLSTTFVFKYNDSNRRVLVNPKSFSSPDINITDNTITIPNHNFKQGQKIIHTSNSPSGGLLNNQIYYVVVFDRDTIKLSPSYFSSVSLEPEIINITSSSTGTLSPVNPPIELYKNSTVLFDLSDSSLSYSENSNLYSAFELNFYLDSNFTQLFDKSSESTEFEVKRQGRVGIDNNARVSLFVSNTLPKKLYYRLDPVYTSNVTLPRIKEEVNVDPSVFSNNQIEIFSSGYEGKHQVVSTSSTTFTYNLEKTPEISSYNSNSSTLEYDTNSLSASGPASEVAITSKGQNYYSIPSFTTIISSSGSGAILEAFSKSIGKIEKTKIDDIGFDFSSDFTIRPNLSLPQILKVEPLSSIESVGITSVGNGYTIPPKLIVIDGKTKNVIPEIDLRYSLVDGEVIILNNTYRLNNTQPTIIPTQNSNGVGISSISYNSITKDVTATLSVGFSTASAFPFKIGDKVLIENVSIGLVTTGRGYNSENYNYQLFTLTGVTTAVGGNGNVTYNIGDYLSANEFPGIFNSQNSSGRIIPEKFFPKFDVRLRTNKFYKNEEVRYLNEINSIGFVEDWNEKTKYLTISSKNNIETSKVIEGVSSKTQGEISSVIRTNSFINADAFSKVERGWITETGTLNNSLQRIHDNFYYQNFSYSLKSKVSYDTWEDAVGSLNHTLGFKKFSDYQCETSTTDIDNNKVFSGVSTSFNVVDVFSDIIGVVDLNCVYDFDLARENALTVSSKIISDEITFSSRILTDYQESIGNRVLSIDDISNFFNSTERIERFGDAYKFNLSDARGQKYIAYVKDKRLNELRQLMVFTILHDDVNGYINQYSRVESFYDLGSFDFEIKGSQGNVLFYPVKYEVNDYDITVFVINIKDNFAGVGSTTIGGIVTIDSNTSFVSSGSTTIANLGPACTSSKVLVEVTGNNGEYQFDELNIINDGTNVGILEYGRLNNYPTESYPNSGLGTYYAYLSGSNLNLDFVSNPGIAATISNLQVSIANTSVTGVGTFDMKYARFESRSTSIASNPSPVSSIIAEYPKDYDAGYFIVQVTDTTNNRYQMSELAVVDDEDQVYFTEFGNIYTNSDLGTISATKTTNSTQVNFTPIPDIDIEVKCFFNVVRNNDDDNFNIDYLDGTFKTGYKTILGSQRDLKKSFDLFHKEYPIFQKSFDAENPFAVNIRDNTITIPNHYLVSGEKVIYSVGVNTETDQPIGISTVDFGVGIGTTDKLPSEVYVIKVSENKIKLAKNAQDALRNFPIELDFTSVGIGTSHTITSINQNSKVLVTIDNIIQSPVVSTSSTTSLSRALNSVDNILYVNNEKDIFINDLLKVNTEIIKVESVGVGSTNSIQVIRPWLGTVSIAHSVGSKVTKISGSYNIVDNTLHFAEAPYDSRTSLGSTSINSPDENDWEGVVKGSTFHGRTFMRSGVKGSSNESYNKNYVFDDISSGFTGIAKTFTLKSNDLSITGISSENSIILINNIFQSPGLNNSYTLSESTGETSISFVGTTTSVSYDINKSDLPSGGIIISVGSTEGFGYQPLVSAGGTVTVSAAGTISAVSIGNSGSGYRTAIRTSSGIKNISVRVGVATSSVETSSIEFIGTATVNNGNIVSIAITNPGVGYTSTNPPHLIIDDPIPYSNIPLIYSSPNTGIGTEATVDIVVGQGSSVIDFELKNNGYGYNVGDILTIPISGSTGIPTTSSINFKEFKITVDDTFTDKFNGWSVGELLPLDSIENLFDGNATIFSIFYGGQLTSIYAQKGSPINIQDTLLVFVNDVLQIPGKGYIFNGGSKIEFTEAPKSGDKCQILFYRGSGLGIDVVDKDIIEEVKVGDNVQLTYDSALNQSPILLEDQRTITDILSIDSVNTNPYFGPGNTSSTTLKRPINLYRQTEDKIIDGKEVTKNRTLYEPLIYPTTYLIQSVGIGSTIAYVESVRPFFNPQNESTSLSFQKKITILSQDTKVSASATAVVSIAGTIAAISISNGGVGYSTQPNVSIQSPTGLGITTPNIKASITSGVVTSISISGLYTGYTQSNPPLVLIEAPSLEFEQNEILSYSGDFGIISGIQTTSVGVASTGIVFDFVIPTDSYLRNSAVSGVTTISGIQTGDYFVISNSNVGNGVTSLNISNSIVGIATNFLDTVYQAVSVSIAQTAVIGMGITYVAKVTVSVSSYNGLSGIGYSGYYGNYSWGKISLDERQKSNSYNAYTRNGYLGISTGTIISRYSPLRYLNYTS